MPEPSAVVYASDRYTPHDHRFLESAAEAGDRSVWFLRLGNHDHSLEGRPLPHGVAPLEVGPAPTDEALRAALTDALVDPRTGRGLGVVHAGPVPTVARRCLSTSPVPVIVMSWASDLLVEVQAEPPMLAAARSALAGAAHVLVDNGAVGRVAVELGAAPDRLTVVPWGVDLEQFCAASARGPGGPLRLLSLRSFEDVYDIPTLLEGVALARATSSAPQIQLTLAGSGSREVSLRALALRLGLDNDVRWLGRVAEPDVAGLLADHDVHVSASLSDGSSISLLQALACGRPSIVTAIESNLEWVNPGVDGWTFAPGDAQGLARQILAAASLRPLRAIGNAARAVAEQRADWEVHRRTILDLYDEVGRAPWT